MVLRVPEWVERSAERSLDRSSNERARRQVSVRGLDTCRTRLIILTRKRWKSGGGLLLPRPL